MSDCKVYKSILSLVNQGFNITCSLSVIIFLSTHFKHGRVLLFLVMFQAMLCHLSSKSFNKQALK